MKNFINKNIKVLSVIFFAILILFISYFTYFKNYSYPAGLFWDENYHIASAEKYIEGSFFMELHPPLGKELIALGEIILNPNSSIDKSEFTKTDYIKTLPNNFSFVGFRFFPALAGFFLPLLFFSLLLLISKNSYLSFIFTSLILFDNAMIVHLRGAMLESIQLAFILISLNYFIYLFNKKNLKVYNYLILGILTSFAFAVKINSLVIAPLGLIILIKENYEQLLVLINKITNINNLKALIILTKEEYNRLVEVINKIISRNNIKESIFLIKEIFQKFFKLINKNLFKNLFKEIFIKLSIYFLGLVSIFFISYYIHFIHQKKVINNNYYTASEDYRTIIDGNQTSLLKNFIFQLNEHLYYTNQFIAGVPKLNLDNPNENGSYPLYWPIGNKEINYRWEKDQTGNSAMYLYLQINPLSWAIGLISIIICFLLLTFYFCKYIYNFYIYKYRNKEFKAIFLHSNINQKGKYFSLILVFTTLYIIYMFTVLNTQRVLYLYHYFVPLILSFILSYLLFLFFFDRFLRNNEFRNYIYYTIFLIALLIFNTFLFFSPLTYYQPLTRDEFNLRNWVKSWQLKSVV